MQQTSEQKHCDDPPTTLKVTGQDMQFSSETPTDETNHYNASAEPGITANTEIATICRTILQGTLKVDGSYNVNGQVMSLQELQRQIGELQGRRQ